MGEYRDVDCLDRLGAELSGQGLECELVTTGVCVPYLHIKTAGEQRRRTGDLHDHIFVSTEPDGRWRYWWPWAEPIADVEEMTRAVNDISNLYRDDSEGMGLT